jgi:predicted PurR-regulated permease PerM
VATVAIIVNGITSQSDEIWARLEASLQQVDENASLPASFDQIIGAAHQVVRLLTRGILGSVFSSASSLVVGSVLAVFMLLFLLKDWQQINTWTAGHMGLPEVVGRTVLDGTVSAFRGYAAGLTLIGAANAVVVALGALVLDVPLVGTIALVSFITSYVPYLGAFVAGAFAVLIAYGSGGLGVALAMLAIVLLANNTIQNLVEPFAFGNRLRLHPLAVLLTVTTATMLFGVMGAILAAPLTSAAANALSQLRGPALPTAGGLPDAGHVGQPSEGAG